MNTVPPGVGNLGTIRSPDIAVNVLNMRRQGKQKQMIWLSHLRCVPFDGIPVYGIGRENESREQKEGLYKH